MKENVLHSLHFQDNQAIFPQKQKDMEYMIRKLKEVGLKKTKDKHV